MICLSLSDTDNPKAVWKSGVYMKIIAFSFKNSSAECLQFGKGLDSRLFSLSILQWLIVSYDCYLDAFSVCCCLQQANSHRVAPMTVKRYAPQTGIRFFPVIRRYRWPRQMIGTFWQPMTFYWLLVEIVSLGLRDIDNIKFFGLKHVFAIQSRWWVLLLARASY